MQCRSENRRPHALRAAAIAGGLQDKAPPAQASTQPQKNYTHDRLRPTAGSIEGTVHFTGKAPERIRSTWAQDPVCDDLSATNLTEQYVVDDGKLANVYVYVKAGLGDKVYAPPSKPAVLDQKGCRYVPHVIGAMVGQPIEFRNSDPTMHNVHMKPTVGGNQQSTFRRPPNGPGETRHAFASLS